MNYDKDDIRPPSKEEIAKAIDAFTENLNKQLKEGYRQEIHTHFDRQYFGHYMVLKTSINIEFENHRPMTEDELKRLMEGRL